MLSEDLDTPCAVVDLDVMENNLRRCQSYLDEHGRAMRPHIKTHKIPEFAHLQVKFGARGINCQKLGEAEVMVEAGIDDILLTYNIVGQAKLDRLVALARRADIKVVADSTEIVEGLSAAMSRAGLTLPVLVECDTGSQRCGRDHAGGGAGSGAGHRSLAGAQIPRTDDLSAEERSAPGSGAGCGDSVDLCERAGLDVAVVSVGGTPDLYHAHEVTAATEHRPGTYIYSDRYFVEAQAFGTWDDCALRIHATVVSHAAADRCIIDAGSKTFSSDLMGFSTTAISSSIRTGNSAG